MNIEPACASAPVPADAGPVPADAGPRTSKILAPNALRAAAFRSAAARASPPPPPPAPSPAIQFPSSKQHSTWLWMVRTGNKRLHIGQGTSPPVEFGARSNVRGGGAGVGSRAITSEALPCGCGVRGGEGGAEVGEGSA